MVLFDETGKPEGLSDDWPEIREHGHKPVKKDTNANTDEKQATLLYFWDYDESEEKMKEA